MSSDLINYSDLMQRAINSVPNGENKLQEVNNILNSALGVHMLLSQYDFYKKSFGQFGDKMAQQGIDLKNSINNFVQNPSSIMDTELAGGIKNVVTDQVNKTLSKFKPGSDIEMSDFTLPSLTELKSVGNIVSSFKPTGEGVEQAFKNFNMMKDIPSAFSNSEGLLNSLKGKISDVKGTLKSLSKGDLEEARQNLQEAISDPEFGQFVEPLKFQFSSLSNKVQSALNDRLGNIPDEMINNLKNNGMNLDDIKLSLMEPQEFKTYLGTIRGVASDKIEQMQNAYQASRGSVDDVINSLKNKGLETQQTINDVGDNLQNRLINVQESLENQALENMNNTKQFLIDSSKQFTDTIPTKVLSKTSEDLGKSLASATEESLGGDEDPVGLAVTAVLGLATIGDTIAEAIENQKTIPYQVGFQYGV